MAFDFSYLGEDPFSVKEQPYTPSPAFQELGSRIDQTPTATGGGFFDKLKGLAGNKDLMAMLGRYGSALSGPDTPMGRVGSTTASIIGSKQMDTALRDVLARFLGQGGSSLSSSSSPFGAGVAGLTPEQVSSVYGAAFKGLSDDKSNLINMMQVLSGIRGQDITAATTTRGQDVTARTAERGQDITKDYYNMMRPAYAKIQQEIDKNNKLDSNWDVNLDAWSSFHGDNTKGIKPPSYVTPELLPVLKGMGREEGGKLIDKLEQLKQQGVDAKAVAHGDKIIIYGGKSGKVLDTIDAPDTKDAATKAWVQGSAERQAFLDVAKEAKNEFMAGFQDKEKAAREFDTMMAMLGQSPNADNQMRTLMGKASEGLRQKWRNLTSHYGKQIASGQTLTPPQAAPGAVPSPEDAVRMEQAKWLNDNLPALLASQKFQQMQVGQTATITTKDGKQLKFKKISPSGVDVVAGVSQANSGRGATGSY